MNAIEKIIHDRFESGDSSIMIEPVETFEPDDGERAFLFINGARDQVLVDFGWGDAGFYIDVRMFVDGEPIEPTVMQLGNTVTVNGRLP